MRLNEVFTKVLPTTSFCVIANTNTVTECDFMTQRRKNWMLLHNVAGSETDLAHCVSVHLLVPQMKIYYPLSPKNDPNCGQNLNHV